MPSESGLAVWDALWQAGEPLGVVAMGLGAQDSLLLEKGYRLWGSDIHAEHNPYEAALGFAVRRNKGDFMGREALARARAEGVKRRLCCMVLRDADKVVMGSEPVFAGDRVIGYVTSANFGYTVGKSIAYGYLPIDHASVGTQVDIMYFGERYPATVAREPLYDPSSSRLKS